MENLRVNKISVDVVWELIWKGWELARVHYSLTLLIVAALSFSLLIGAIPIVGPMISTLVGCFAPLVFLKACESWEKGEKSRPGEVFSVLKNKPLINHLFPLIAINFVVVGGSAYLQQLGGPLSMMLSVVTLPVTLALQLTYPIMFFNPGKIQLGPAISLALRGLGKNIGPFIVASILLIVIVLFSTIALILPLFFFGIPIFITFYYLWYRVVHEDLVLDVKEEDII